MRAARSRAQAQLFHARALAATLDAHHAARVFSGGAAGQPAQRRRRAAREDVAAAAGLGGARGERDVDQPDLVSARHRLDVQGCRVRRRARQAHGAAQLRGQRASARRPAVHSAPRAVRQAVALPRAEEGVGGGHHTRRGGAHRPRAGGGAHLCRVLHAPPLGDGHHPGRLPAAVEDGPPGRAAHHAAAGPPQIPHPVQRQARAGARHERGGLARALAPPMPPFSFGRAATHSLVWSACGALSLRSAPL